jgi:hypothetical protein
MKMSESDKIAAPGAGSRVSVEELEKQLADLQARLPAHSIPPSMILELDELEEALDHARRQRQAKQATEGIPGARAPGIISEGSGGRH